MLVSFTHYYSDERRIDNFYSKVVVALHNISNRKFEQRDVIICQPGNDIFAVSSQAAIIWFGELMLRVRFGVRVRFRIRVRVDVRVRVCKLLGSC